MTSLIEKFRSNPLRLEELSLIDFSGFKFWKGTYRRFGFWCAFHNICPLSGFLNEAFRGFPYRNCYLSVDESSFTFKKGDELSQPKVIDGGKK